MHIRILVAAFLLSLAAVLLLGVIVTGDHRTDRNVPGSTTGPGRSSLTE
jgi:hypothetical protein